MRQHRTKPVPPVAHCFVANLDPALMQEAFNVVQRQREPNVRHHLQGDDLSAGLEVAEWWALGHP